MADIDYLPTHGTFFLELVSLLLTKIFLFYHFLCLHLLFHCSSRPPLFTHTYTRASGDTLSRNDQLLFFRVLPSSVCPPPFPPLHHFHPSNISVQPTQALFPLVGLPPLSVYMIYQPSLPYTPHLSPSPAFIPKGSASTCWTRHDARCSLAWCSRPGKGVGRERGGVAE